MRNKAIVILFFILLAVFSVRGHGNIPPAEREALIALYNSTNGDNWDNNGVWKIPPLHSDGFATPGTEHTWIGVTCDGGNTTVLKIELVNNNLDGTIPTELGNLGNLEYLDLNSNQLSGGIPAALGSLSNLTYLDLHSNQFTEIPPGLEWGKLSNLEKLYLNNNPFECNIPPGPGNLSSLIVLGLHSCQLTGSIPTSFGNLTGLEKLYLNDNRISGNIPREMGDPSNLKELKINGNRLTGEIPSNIASLTNLIDNQSDFRWNALYTNDESLRDFLNSKQDGGDWESTQTTAPGNVNAETIDCTSIEITWCPIPYQAGYGGYRVFYSTTPGGDYILYGTTDDKSVDRMEITGLSGDTAYYFVVQTRTGSHGNNDNIVDSEYSAEGFATTSDGITIQGSVTFGDNGLSGVTLTFSDTGGSKTATTDSKGDYSRMVNRGWSGKVTPSHPEYEFEPPSRLYTNEESDRSDQDYSATLKPVISGRVIHPTDTGIAGLSGVTLAFALGGVLNETEITDADGYYSHAVNSGCKGNVTPFKAGYTFSPPSQPYENVTSNITGQDYTATAIVISPVISGRVTFEGDGLPGVKLDFSNNGGTTYTDDNGDYKKEVPDGWSGNVTPEETGYEFEPVGHNGEYENVTSDITDQDYEATEIRPVISGRVETTPEDTGLSGVTLTFSNDAGSTTTTTDSNGNYSQGVSYEWSGKVTPEKNGYEFEPVGHDGEYKNVTSDKTGRNYKATPNFPVISGKVTDSEGMGMSGVTLTFSSNSGEKDITYTDGNGNYSQAVPGGWSGTVTAEKTGYDLKPDGHDGEYVNVTFDYIDQDYEATANSPVISGRAATAPDGGIASVKLTFSDNGGTVYTDNNGNYSQAVPNGWLGTVTPSKPLYTFDPHSREYTEAVNGNKPGENYTATAIEIPPVISGRVTFEDTSLSGVTLTFSNKGGTAYTDDDGKYNNTVYHGWSGRVTPEKEGYEFEPAGHNGNYENVTSDMPNQDYKATRIPPVISGRVTFSTSTGIEGLHEVKMIFSSDDGGTETKTNVEGYYECQVVSGWSGTVTPKKAGYYFSPLSQPYQKVDTNRTGQNFTAAEGSVALDIEAERLEEKKMMISKEYVKITVTLDDKEGDLDISGFMIRRKEPGSAYIDLIPVEELQKSIPETFYDWDIKKNKSYIYKVEARDKQGKAIGVSDETEEI
jgi:hypothetical protein